MLRASAACEAAGIPSSTLVCEGFLQQAAFTAVGLGMPNLPVAAIPGHPGVQSDEELARNIADVTFPQIVENLTRQPQAAVLSTEPAQRSVVFAGSFDAVNTCFEENEWSDGLPVVPPTLDRVEAFLRFTDLAPDASLGVMLPDQRNASVWSVAVNGVMAGCAPRYMPVLLAIAEALCDPEYGVEHSGNTPGAETLIVINGPIIKQLGFNFEQGVMRDGFRANTSVGRFLRLLLRNVAGFLPHKTDKATFGGTWRVAIAENEDVLARIGWEPMSAEFGFSRGENVVSLARYTGGDVIVSVNGDTPEAMLPYIADAILRQTSWQMTFTMSATFGMLRPMLLLSPILAERLAGAGWSKQDVKRYLFEHARMPAEKLERLMRDWTNHVDCDLAALARLGKVPKSFHASDDPGRLVPLVFHPDDFTIAVTGDPMRTNAYTLSHNGTLGYPVGKRILLPRAWDDLIAGRDA